MNEIRNRYYEKKTNKRLKAVYLEKPIFKDFSYSYALFCISSWDPLFLDGVTCIGLLSVEVSNRKTRVEHMN